MNLLIVDDEIFAIQGILDGVNWEELSFDRVLTANSYSQAINIFMENKIDVLLCDIEMPYGSGLDLVEWVKNHYPDTECIFLTCHSEFTFASQAIKLRCYDYVLKPAPPDVLADLLRKVINAIEERRQKQTYQDYGKLYVQNLSKHSLDNTAQSQNSVEKVEAYIREHISETLTVEELAKQVHLNPEYLTRSFKKKYNMTLINYITDQRMFLAKELLIKNEMSISMISVKVGYGNYSYFTKMFKKCYGITPREFQQEYLSKGKKM
jgi:Response regulator containing CheY-like receiver domain and AraC-type DNA-binding domain